MADDFIFRGTAAELDPELERLVNAEDKRQKDKIILVASESIAPRAVQEMMGSNFSNIYAEGYPREESRYLTEDEILDIEAELAYYRRYGDPRYYKGVEFADMLEALARRRAAELFAANGVSPDRLFVNVQPLSGSPANSAVYSALLEPGDTLMGLDLIDGGHLTHGSKVSRSGILYNAVSYRLDPETELLDYDEIERLALEHNPRIIVAGFTAYPKIINWGRFREIADRCGALLMADIAHISGLVAAGIHPNPVGIADVVTTTTHKSLCGPRGAMIMSHHPEMARKIDRAVFPGEQGGPHLNTIAALALALKLAKGDLFAALQKRVLANARRLGERLAANNIRIVAGGSENHLLLVDCKSIRANGETLSGEMAARILDAAGIVTNRNTIPGDPNAFAASGIRIGTVWISQLGFEEKEVELLADAITATLKGCQPFSYMRLGGRTTRRAKVAPDALKTGREMIDTLTAGAPTDGGSRVLKVRGAAAADFLDLALTADVQSLKLNGTLASKAMLPEGEVDLLVVRENEALFVLHLANEKDASKLKSWLSDLSDGYVKFADVYAKLPGPVVVEYSAETASVISSSASMVLSTKPFFVGHEHYDHPDENLPAFVWQEPENAPLRRTALFDTHVALGGRMVPFGGWEMPVRYGTVTEEHLAVREKAGLFDVSHMGVLEVSGPHAAKFLNFVTTNDIDLLDVGRSHYTYLLNPDGSVVDDLLIYRRAEDRFMLVVNAANNDKDWAWINAVNQGEVRIDDRRPWIKIQHPAEIRDLRDSRWGDACLVDIALQGPNSTAILLSLCDDDSLAQRIRKLPWAGLVEGQIAGFDLVVSRTGYTGERKAFELFVHPDRAVDFWKRLLEAGEAHGIMPCGLAARDSTRTEAGLPLYGHELAGPLGLNPADAGFGSYVKTWKPFFVGRDMFLEHEAQRTGIVVRFRMNEKGVRRPELGDPVLDRRGKIVGYVTSCAIDREGYLLGQAYVPLELSQEGAQLAIYQLGGGTRKINFPEGLETGTRLPIPDLATVLSRFP